jgi:hypothetical protein
VLAIALVCNGVLPVRPAANANRWAVSAKFIGKGEQKMDWNVFIAGVVALLISVLSSVISSVLMQRNTIEKRTRNIIVILGILSALAIVASSLISSEQESHKVPTFSGKVGNFDNSKPLWDFISKQDGKFIYLDIYMDSLNVEASFAPPLPSFTLWVTCPLLQSGEEPSSLTCSEGNMYVFSEPLGNNYIFEPYRGVNKVKGYFFVEDITGPFLGVMAIKLRPVAAENVILK